MAEVVAPTQVNQEIETRKSADKEPDRSDFWLGEIEAAKKREDGWWKRGQKVIDRYRDERNKDDGFEKRTNILWSNTEIMKATLFNGMGKPDVRRRFSVKGKQERATRTAAIVLERALAYCRDAYDADSEVECAVEDHLLPGRGVTWCVYEADVEEPVENDDDAAEGEAPHEKPDAAAPLAPVAAGEQAGPEIKDQRVRMEHVFWRDFLTSFGRKWPDVWWAGRRHLYSRDELRRYFKKHADKIPLGADIEGAQKQKDGKDDTFKRAAVWEIWDKSKKQRVYVAEGYDLVLQAEPDPYKLERFFPCQEPLYGVKTTSSLVPVPEYTVYQDQAQELDHISTRIDILTEGLKRRGVYDATLEGPDNQLSSLKDAGDNEFLPYKGFAALMEKGGLKGVFQTEDLTPTIAVIKELYTARGLCIQSIYEVTGISDILRGASNPNETATAQRLKGQVGSLRIGKRQARVQRFVADGYRIKAEIIAEHFTREKLQAMTGIRLPLAMEVEQAKQMLTQMQQAQQMAQQQAQQAQQPQVGHNGGPPMGQQAPAQPMMPQPPPQPQMSPEMVMELRLTASAVPWEDIKAILRSDQRRGYMIDVESDATGKLDDVEEKNSRIEFMTAMQGYMEKSLPMAMQAPALLPLIKELTLFGVKAFPVGRQMEETFEDAFEQLGQQAAKMQQQGPQPDPKAQAEAEKAKVEMAAMQAKAQTDQMKAQADIQGQQVKAQVDQVKAQADQAKAQAEVTKTQAQAEHDRFTMAAERQDKVMELRAKQESAQLEKAGRIVDLQTKVAKASQPQAPS